MNHVSQILENFLEKLKDILAYLFKIEKQIDIYFEIIPPLFQTNGSIVPAYHHVYIKHNKEPRTHPSIRTKMGNDLFT